MCVGLLACLMLCLHSHHKFVGNNSNCACKHACVYVYIMQNSLSSHPIFKKKSQPGGHFEIPGAHLANPGNWGVYISATERKRPDAAFSCSAASIQRSLTSPWVTDLCVCLLWKEYGHIESTGQSHKTPYDDLQQGSMK